MNDSLLCAEKNIQRCCKCVAHETRIKGRRRRDAYLIKAQIFINILSESFKGMEDGWSDAFGKEGLKKSVVGTFIQRTKKTEKVLLRLTLTDFLIFGQSLKCGYIFTNDVHRVVVTIISPTIS